MAENTVLKHFQIFRNTPVVSATSHAAAVTDAKTKFATLTGLKDGELVLYRYKLDGETTIHTLVGVHYILNNVTTYEILGNYDQLTAEYKAWVDAEIKKLDATATIASVAEGVVTLKAGIVETDGLISNSNTDDITLAKVATTGAAADVTVATIDGLEATTVQDALTELQGDIKGLQTIDPVVTTVVEGTGIKVADTVTGNDHAYTVAANIKMSLVGNVLSIFDKDAVEGDTAIATVDLSKFAVDGMLDNATYEPTTKDLTLTFNTAAGKNDIVVPLDDLVDTYTADETYLTVANNKFSHKTTGVTADTYAANAADISVNSTTSKSFKVPTLTVDAAGHVTAASEKTVTITLPASIDSAVQTINGHNLNETFITTTVTPSTDNKTQSIEVTAKIGDVETATDGLATASDVKTYVDTNITTAIEALNVDPLSLTTLNDDKLEGYQISELDGKIVKGETANTLLTFATAPTAENKVATQAEITNAITALNANVTSEDGVNFQVNVTEVGGKITAVNVVNDLTAAKSALDEEIARAKAAEEANAAAIATEKGRIDGMDLTATPIVSLDGSALKASKIKQEDGLVSVENAANVLEFASVPSTTNKVATMTEVNAAKQATTYTAGTGISISDDNAISTTVTLNYNSDSKKIQLLDKVDGTAIGEIDATAFIKDGMLTNAELVTNPDGKPAGEYIKLTFNADAEQDPIYINVADLCDVYRVKENDWIQLNGFEFSHKTQTGLPEGPIGSVDFSEAITDSKINDAEDSVEIKVPTITVDAAGHVTALTETMVGIILPESIATAVQTINGHAQNNTFITTTVTPSDDNKTQSIIVTAKIGGVANAIEGLAEAKEVRSYVDTKVDAAIEALDSTATIASESNGVVTLNTSVVETNGKISTNNTNSITLSKVATTGDSGDVIYSGEISVKAAIAALEAVDTWDAGTY